MTDQPPQPPPGPPPIPPQPLPTNVTVNFVRVQVPGRPPQTQLRWDITTPAGVAVFFSDKAFSQAIAKILMDHLQGWPAELVVPQIDMGAIERELGRPNGKR